MGRLKMRKSITVAIALILGLQFSAISMAPVSAVVDTNQAVNKLQQLTSGGHVLGFGEAEVYIAGLDHALSVDFIDGRAVTPISTSSGGSRNGGVPLEQITYKGTWDNIDIIYKGIDDGIMESTYIVHPGGDPNQISLRYNRAVEIMPGGELRFTFESGYLTESAPVAWQEIYGQRIDVAVSFRKQGDNQVGYLLGRYNPNHILYIDPDYQWHTFYGATDWDIANNAIAVDSQGNVYVAGYSRSTWNGPSGQIPLHAYPGGMAVCILKLNSDGIYQWHTFYDGTAVYIYGTISIAIDSNTNVYVSLHSSSSWDGPSSQAPLNAYQAGLNICILKLNSSGSYLWHTFYGGIGGSWTCSLTFDASNNIYVAGHSYGTWNGPSGQSPLHVFTGGICVLKLNSDGVYLWHTFYGATSSDIAGAALDADANIYVAGYSYASWNGPSGQAPLHAYPGGNRNICVIKLDKDGTYQWHTFYGGPSSDYGIDVALDTEANIYLVGLSNTTWNGPLDRAPLNPFSGSQDISVLKLDKDGDYQWHTFYYVHSAYDWNFTLGIGLDTFANVYVAAYSTAAWNGPSGQTPQHAFAGNNDAAMLNLDKDGVYQWHTFYGGTGSDRANAITLDSSGNVYLAGESSTSWNGPTEQSPLHPWTGGTDIFILKLNGNQPAVTTNAATNITTTSAALNGNLTSLGTSQNATVSFQWGNSSGTYTHNTTPRIKTIIGAFSDNLTDLLPETVYYFRAQATENSSTIYGNELTFTTATARPTVTTGEAMNISANSAKLHGNLAGLGIAASCNVTFQYGIASNTFSSETPAIELSEPDDFEYKVSDLAHGTTYYYRAKAVGNGTAYGEEKSFTTSGKPSSITTTTNTGTLTLHSNLGTITSLSAIGLQTMPHQLPQVLFPHGLMYFEVSNIEPGSTVTFTITFPTALPAYIQYWKYQPSHGFFQIPITSHSGRTVAIQITDGGLGDADGLANGVIIDPGGVAIPNGPESGISTTMPPSSAASVSAVPTGAPVALSNIYVQSASLSTAKVSPGTTITVTANVANRGTVNGTARIKLYVNGEEDSSQGITVESGGSRSVCFTVNRNEPGMYAVYVGGTQAGNFTIEDAIDSNMILVISCSLIALSLILGMIYILKRRNYSY